MVNFASEKISNLFLSKLTSPLYYPDPFENHGKELERSTANSMRSYMESESDCLNLLHNNQFGIFNLLNDEVINYFALKELER